MGKVHKLDRLTSNKIAAGEVVEKPASVVKELIENSIDAGSTSIILEIKNGGKTLMKITDNGHGIEEDDILIAFERHATSKINSVEDIYSIKSLGFRGEALASISSVSNIELITKTESDTSGSKLVLSGSKMIEQKPFGCNVGTQIAVKDLFFNTPARLKFLKSNVAEQSAITDIINKLAISNPQIGFKYVVDSKNMFLTKDDNNLKNTIFSIYGRSIASNLLEVSDEVDGIKIKGFVSNLQLTRGNRQLQNLFVNNRYIKNTDISEGIKSAYKTMMPIGRHPIVFLFLDIDPSTVDVNVHPAKTEVKFGNSAIIKQAVYAAIRKALISYDLVPKSTISTNSYTNFINDDKLVFNQDNANDTNVKERLDKISLNTSATNKDISEEVKRNIIKDEFLKNMGHEPTRLKSDQASDTRGKDTMVNLDTPNNPTCPNISKPDEFRKVDFASSTNDAPRPSFTKPIGLASTYKTDHVDFKKEMNILDDIFVKESAQIVIDDVNDIIPSETSVYDDLFYIGVIFKTYLLFEKNSQMYMIDQHAAHEKVLFEEYIELYKEKKIPSQIMLEPLIIDLSYADVIKVESNHALFESLGIGLEVFGNDSIIVRELPVIFNLPVTKNFILEIIEKIDEKEVESLYTLKVDRIISASCKNAIKANDTLMDIEVASLLNRLKTLSDPYTCPHGRPIIISISKGEIMKKFKRT
ncbi:MAG: DNA mismatch repair endonuclease MutL [Acidaminobacteraceae bacterium]